MRSWRPRPRRRARRRRSTRATRRERRRGCGRLHVHGSGWRPILGAPAAALPGPSARGHGRCGLAGGEGGRDRRARSRLRSLVLALGGSLRPVASSLDAAGGAAVADGSVGASAAGVGGGGAGGQRRLAGLGRDGAGTASGASWCVSDGCSALSAASAASLVGPGSAGIERHIGGGAARVIGGNHARGLHGRLLGLGSSLLLLVGFGSGRRRLCGPFRRHLSGRCCDCACGRRRRHGEDPGGKERLRAAADERVA